jgi:hypothetical protein
VDHRWRPVATREGRGPCTLTAKGITGPLPIALAASPSWTISAADNSPGILGSTVLMIPSAEMEI